MAGQQSGNITVIRDDGADRAVVFLHGYSGDRNDTWDRFPGLLGTHIDGWDIFALGYATTVQPDVVGVWSADPDLPILAGLLRTRMTVEPLSRYRSVALVAHSMGGLIVQRALVDEPALAERSSHVVLFGTPSGGLKKARWARFWKRQLRNMAHGSDFILRLREDWSALFDPEPAFQFVTVAGTKDQFVPPWSSLDPFAARFQRVVPGDHLSIVKPEGADSPSVALLVSMLGDAEPPAQTVEPLSLAAERATLDVRALVEEQEQSHQLSEAEVVDSALALERAGERNEAIELLQRHQALGTDVQGTLGGRIKRIWLESENPEDAQRAYDIYSAALAMAQEALETAKEMEDTKAEAGALDQIYYQAINVAFLEFVFHDRPKRAAEMAKLAHECAEGSGENLWTIATRAEAQLYLDRPDEAVALYTEMFKRYPDEPKWKHASASLQATQVAGKMNDTGLAERLEAIFTPGASQVNKIFVSYSHKDSEWASRLEVMAAPYLRDSETELDLWVDTRLEAGDRWHEEIQNAVTAAGAAVALVSADFLASEYIWKHEMPALLDAADTGDLRLLWVYLKSAGWEETGLSKFQAVHDTKKPLAALEEWEQDEVLKAVAVEIKKVALGATDRFVAQAESD